MKPALDHLLATLDADPQAFSVCRIQRGWRMTFPASDQIIVHFVLRGAGHCQLGRAPPIPFLSSSVLVVPARETHWVGQAGGEARVHEAADQCALVGDGLVEFTAGGGFGDTLMLCGAIPARYQGVFGFFDLLQMPLAADGVADGVPASVFDAMANEIAGAGFGTQAMCQALMKQGLIALLRGRWRDAAPPAGAVPHPRLARAVAAILDDPAGAHTVESLASLAGMSRASFSDHFAKAFGRGPIDFVQKARLRIAARLLRTTDLPVKAVAKGIAYAGPRPFSRAFQIVYRCTPSEYRLATEDEIQALSAEA